MVSGAFERIAAAPIFLSEEEYEVAKERGRLMAAEALRLDLPHRRRMEKRFGERFCRQRWPEAYQERSGI